MNEVPEANNSGWDIASVATARGRWTEHTGLATARMAKLAGDALWVSGILPAAFRVSDGVVSDPALSSVLSWLYAGLGTVIFAGALPAMASMPANFYLIAGNK